MDEEEIKKIIVEGYRDILKREPDLGGLLCYTKKIKNGLNLEKFYMALRSSEEYKQKSRQLTPIIPFNTHHKKISNMVNNPDIKDIHDIAKTSNIKYISNTTNNPNIKDKSNMITYCMMGGNKLYEIKEYIPTVIPYVDKLVYIDSGSTDGSIEFLRDLSSKNNNKIDVIIKEWQDKFSYFRNFYLEHLRNKNYNGWVLTSDTDEHYPLETLSKLRDLTVGNYSGIKFRSYDILIDDNDRTKIISESLSTFWKGLLFKFHKKLYYSGEPHEALVGIPMKWQKTDLIYKHIRSQRKVYERAVENFFISNSNRYSTKWSEFRLLCTKNNMLKFGDFFKFYKEGTLSKDIENWIYDHKDDNENSGDSEVREMAKLYYEILHQDKINK